MTDPQRIIADLRRELANARAERDEAFAQQVAASDVLQTISRAGFHLQSVLDAIAEAATRLCNADYCGVLRRHGETYRIAATAAFTPKAIDGARKYQAFLEQHPLAVDRGSITGRVALEGQIVHVEDTTADPEYRLSQATSLGKLRTQLGVPLLQDGQPIGVIVVARQRVRPFSERQIELVRTFADQAVIAMENARLITETREALDQQTATAEVLGVINSSPGDLAPVFDVTLEKALNLCDAVFGVLWTYDGDRIHVAAHRGEFTWPDELIRRGLPTSAEAVDASGRLLRGEPIVHIADITEDIDYEAANQPRRLLLDAGTRSLLAVPLWRDSIFLGYFAIYRREVRAFTDKQIALLQNFAAQAVIAMENARLITETREALEQQTATAEVLGVINSSPGDLTPVFDAILEKAHHLCGASYGSLQLIDGATIRAVAVRGLIPEFAAWLRQGYPVSSNVVLQRMDEGAPFVQLPDLAEINQPVSKEAARAGLHTFLGVPLRHGHRLLGQIVAARPEVRLFAEKEIALLQSFAAQAVIAMENARLLTETQERSADLQEALGYQTATSDVLQVISRSTFDLQPVLDTLVQTAARLCVADGAGMTLREGEVYRYVAVSDLTSDFFAFLRQHPFAPGRDTMAGRIALEGNIVHIDDITIDPEYDLPEAFSLGGIRTMLGVPLLRDGAVLGTFSLIRRRVEPFTQRQIELVKTFADQAVIAIENARLISETREALEQQTATAEVLGVINSSPGDLTPVFDAMLEKAMRLCEAAFGGLWTFDRDQFMPLALRGIPTACAAFFAVNTMLPGPGTAPYRFLRAGERSVIEDIDLMVSEAYRAGDPARRALVDLGGARSALQVPLVKDDAVLGLITVYRQEVRQFTDKQIALLQNFAAQAVIAMENARLLGDLRERTSDLEEALEYQTATSDVLKVISQSDADLTYVLQTTLDTAARLCAAGWGHIFLRRGKRLQTMASLGVTDENKAEMDANPVAVDARSVSGRTVLTGQLVQIADIAVDPEYAHALTLAAGIRTMLGVPLLRDGDPIGAIGLGRTVVEPFTVKQMELVRTFADQAVIAIENARLLGEIQQRQAELRVTFDNMADGVAMFDASLRLAAWNRNFQEMLDLPDELLARRPGYEEYIRFLTERGEFGDSDPKTEIARLRSRSEDHYSFERTRPDGTVMEVRHNPMPDGGFVLIYSDITERKRSEEEIRAARDAAEAAYHDLQAAQANLVQAQKMAALGQLTAGIAHEIKNPLNFVNNFASLSVELLDELKETTKPALATLDEDKRTDVDDTMGLLTGNLEKIAEHGKRADNIVKSMLEHSRGVSGERREVDVNALIEEALNLAYHGARAQDTSFNVTLERDYAASIAPMELAPQEMTRVFLNLFGNGFYATNKRVKADGDAGYRPTLSIATREADDTMEIKVRDNGTGIPTEIRDKLFQPFFTTKPTGEGTGLGLSISYDIVTQQHGGTITVESEPGSFTEFTVRLPRH